MAVLIDVSYCNDFKVTSQSVNGSFEVPYAYDNDGLLSQSGDLTISHDPMNGMLTGTSLGAITTNYNYNTYGDLKQYVAQYGLSDVFHADYELDDIGRITGITETCLGKTNAFKYKYDLSGRLVQVSRNDTTISKYFFDDNGNRISYIANSDTVHGVYDDQDRMLAYGNTVYQYNAQGSLTTKISGVDTTRYTYDLMGNLLAVTQPNGDEIEYLIDAQNRRVGKILNGVVVKKWIYQDQLNPVAELNGNDSVLTRFVYGSKAHVPDYIMKGDTTYRVITDHLGSVRAVVNVVTGEVAQEISYNEFGVVLHNSNQGFQPFAYAGGLYDVQTGLVRFGARDYDAGVGRWTAKDPIGFGRGMNYYIYIGNDPINMIDPFGLDALNYDISDGVLTHFDNDGNVVNSWPATTGPHGNGALPPGEYSLTGRPSLVPAEHRNQASYCDSNGNCWWQPIDPDFDTDRDGLGIHPDGNVPGTAGCIGATDPNTNNLYNTLLNNPNMPLTVEE